MWKAMATYHIFLSPNTQMAGRTTKRYDMRVNGGTARLETLQKDTGEEPILIGSTTVTDDGCVPKPSGSSQLEGGSAETKQIRLRSLLRIATWNVRTLSSGNLSTVISESERYKIDILGIAEHRWSGQGHFRPEEGGTFIYSGRETSGYGGVGIYLAKQTAKALMGYNPISDRVISVRPQGRPKNITLIQVYAPTSASTQEEAEEFYDTVKNAIDGTPTRDMLVLMGDFNAKIGEGAEPRENATIGQFGLGKRNERGESLASFAAENELVICNTLFKQHKCRLIHGQLQTERHSTRLITSWFANLAEEM